MITWQKRFKTTNKKQFTAAYWEIKNYVYYNELF